VELRYLFYDAVMKATFEEKELAMMIVW